MDTALNPASASNTYVLADGAGLSFKNRGDLAILIAGDKRMFNNMGNAEQELHADGLAPGHQRLLREPAVGAQQKCV